MAGAAASKQGNAMLTKKQLDLLEFIHARVQRLSNLVVPARAPEVRSVHVLQLHEELLLPLLPTWRGWGAAVLLLLVVR